MKTELEKSSKMGMEEDKPPSHSGRHPHSSSWKQKQCRSSRHPGGPPSSCSRWCPRFSRSQECVLHLHSRQFSLFSLEKLRRRGHSFVVCKYTRGMNTGVGAEISKLRAPVGMRTNGGPAGV